ncbi:glutamate synthase domain-containing protein 2 [Williamsia limnetica]|uniref:Glutamate synthase domain-containing protein 2 n=1 Tax=Williamsia limnetica TaxID=882452 RepID=A0A318RJQ8_WILLI|nr:FMN-binding glutamate synthase family protein [Williamsia limnetica]PYE18051.1 glutamate synthase domain-containing protein 2 [Williamsia limnetica]
MKFYVLCGLLGVAGVLTFAAAVNEDTTWWFAVAMVVIVSVVAIHDVVQKKHAILRNYPVLGHMRFLLESIRPELQQYFIERNYDGRPYDRNVRSLIYQRSKGLHAEQAFGTEREITEPGYDYLLHSMAPVKIGAAVPTVRIGGPQCSAPFDASLFNISSMSFGALSANAVRAMNKGAALGGFLHETGEGGITAHHLEYGAPLVWEIGSGYFGCRDRDGHFDPELFAQKASHPNVKMILIKLSQGAKPGLGGVLPGAKVTAAIAEARGVPPGVTVISPPAHSAFSSPIELMHFVGTLRRLSGGKPVGFKLCVGTRTDLLALCKAMLQTGVLPDFITVDGAEGGTGAAPPEFSDHVGTPLKLGLMMMHNALVGSGLRGAIKIGAAGKVASGTDIVKTLALGADFTNAARAMMMAVGCIQAQSCHTNRCPVGVATQDPRRARALNVQDKGDRVLNYQQGTVESAMQVLAAMGLSSFEDLGPALVMRRVGHSSAESFEDLFEWLDEGELVRGSQRREWNRDWERADPTTFAVPKVRTA